MMTLISIFLLMLGSMFGVKTQDSLPITHNTIGYAQVKLVIKPEALKINPGVLTAFVKFPAGFVFDVANIINATCDGAEYESMELSDYGMTMVIKFRRKAIEEALAQIGEIIDTEFEVRGTFKIDQQTYIFKGTDTIKKVLPESVPPEEKGKRVKK